MALVIHTQNTIESQNAHEVEALLFKLHEEKLLKAIILYKKHSSFVDEGIFYLNVFQQRCIETCLHDTKC